MLPITHLLAGLALGIYAHSIGLFGETFVILTIIVSVGVDADHLVRYFLTGAGGLRSHWNRLAADKLRHKRTLIHHSKGIALTSILIASTYFWDARVFFSLALAYGSHMTLDHLHLRHPHRIRSYHVKGLGILLPYSVLELCLDVLFLCYLLGWALL